MTTNSCLQYQVLESLPLLCYTQTIWKLVGSYSSYQAAQIDYQRYANGFNIAWLKKRWLGLFSNLTAVASDCHRRQHRYWMAFPSTNDASVVSQGNYMTIPWALMETEHSLWLYTLDDSFDWHAVALLKLPISLCIRIDGDVKVIYESGAALYHRFESRWSVLFEPLMFQTIITELRQKRVWFKKCCQDLSLVDALHTYSFSDLAKCQTSVTFHTYWSHFLSIWRLRPWHTTPQPSKTNNTMAM